ncbi:MAG: EF-P beta-lysylation protein EpmB [Desulforhopalus sp.]
MPHIISRNTVSVEQNWLIELANAISDPVSLFNQLKIPSKYWPADLAGQPNSTAKKRFGLRVPQSFIDKMEMGNIHDPLLRQVLPLNEESKIVPGYSSDPLDEQNNDQPGLLHKYRNRALLIVKSGCAINCRYCFRRHFPHDENNGSKSVWQKSLTYINAHTELNEVILSGGEPLMAKDHELEWLIDEIGKIAHVKRLRIHSRLPVVIPSRVTNKLCRHLHSNRLNIIMVSHINHTNEIDDNLRIAFSALKQAGVTLLNQSVLLKGVNDSVDTQVALNETLFDAGIQPYYLHVLDKVQGAAHYYVSDQRAKTIITEMMTKVSGYMVPRLTREIGGRPSKTPLDLNLE